MSGASLALSGTFALVVVEGTEKTLRRCACKGQLFRVAVLGLGTLVRTFVRGGCGSIRDDAALVGKIISIVFSGFFVVWDTCVAPHNMRVMTN